MKNFLLYLFFALIVHNASSQGSGSCGTFRWNIKTLTEPGGLDLLHANPQKSSIDKLVALQRPSSYDNGPKGDTFRYAPEKASVTIHGRIVGHKLEDDGDYHVVIASTENPDHTLIAEFPSPDCDEISAVPELRELFGETRSDYEEITGTRPKRGKLQPVDNIEIEVTGFPFFDKSHGSIGHMENGMEIHPVIAVRQVTPSTASYNGPSAASFASDPGNEKEEAPKSPTNILFVILIGAFLGAAGQGFRVIVGLKKNGQLAKNLDLTSADLIDYKRTAFSLFVGLCIGAIGGILMVVNNGIEVFDKATMLSIITAGYAGTDLVEGAFMPQEIHPKMKDKLAVKQRDK
jgi:hypothetical protein